MPASNDTRVRVDGFWKTSATIRSVAAPRDERGAAFSSAARSSSAASSSARQLGAGEEVARQGGEDTAAMLRADLEPLPRPLGARRAGRDLLADFAALLAGWEWDVALLQEVPPWWPPAARPRVAAPSARTALTSRNCLLPLRRALAPSAGPTSSSPGRRRRQRDPRARRGDRASTAARRCARGPSGAWCTASASSDGSWVAQPPRPGRTPRRARRPTSPRAAATAIAWAGDAPVVLGGDLNIAPIRTAPGFDHVGRPQRRPRPRPGLAAGEPAAYAGAR